MKKILLGLALISSSAFGQSTLTSVQDGDFFAIGTWDCICVPTDGDTVIINHDINMNTGIPYTAGSITINSTGSLTDGGTDKDIYINGGQLINNGLLECDGFLLDSGFIQNNGTMTLDSLWTRDTMENAQNAVITVYDFFHERFYYQNQGDIIITNNFTNSGDFENYLWGNIHVANDMSNCNITADRAEFWNNGNLCIDGDFTNCADDTLTGAGGKFFIAGSSSNLGHASGILTVNTPTSGFSVNTGTTGTGVSFGNETCPLASAQETSIQPVFIYPNPVDDIMTITAHNVNYKIYDISGRMVQKGSSISGIVGVDELRSGTYLIIISNQEIKTVKQTFVKL
jgi:hypothetical protein